MKESTKLQESYGGRQERERAVMVVMRVKRVVRKRRDGGGRLMVGEVGEEGGGEKGGGELGLALGGIRLMRRFYCWMCQT